MDGTFAYVNATPSTNGSVPTPHDQHHGLNLQGLTIMADIVGWGYFFAWSISFYPQVYLNWKRKSVTGLSFDFLALNITALHCVIGSLGYIAYSVYNVSIMYVVPIRDSYVKVHGYPLPVELNDVIFSLHGFLLTSITIVQCFIYERGDQKVSLPATAAITIGWLSVAVNVALAFLKYESWFFFVTYLSYVKVVATFLKYIPQAYDNFRRKSTIGWSIGNILLDFTGGVLSFVQQFLQGLNSGNWDVFFGNLAKVGLSAISTAFDILFILQHYVFYRHSNTEDKYEPINDDKTAEISGKGVADDETILDYRGEY